MAHELSLVRMLASNFPIRKSRFGAKSRLATRWKPAQSQLGRFLSEDPIGIRGGLNRYNYVNSNPTNAVDPSGLAYTTTLTRAQMVQVDASIQEIRNQGFKLEADLLSRQIFENGDFLPGNTAGLTSPISNQVFLKTPSSGGVWDHVWITQLLFHEAQHLKQEHCPSGSQANIFDGIVGHWYGDPISKFELEYPAYSAERKFAEKWSKTASPKQRKQMLMRADWADWQAAQLEKEALDAGMPYRFKH